MAAKIQIPKHLTGQSRAWFEQMLEAYAFDDEPHALRILQAAAEQLQRAEGYREAIVKHGLVYADRNGNPRENPACVGERACHNTFRLLCRELGVEPAATAEDVRLPRVVGRPA